jgi:hypothetical protein
MRFQAMGQVRSACGSPTLEKYRCEEPSVGPPRPEYPTGKNLLHWISRDAAT